MLTNYWIGQYLPVRYTTVVAKYQNEPATACRFTIIMETGFQISAAFNFQMVFWEDY